MGMSVAERRQQSVDRFTQRNIEGFNLDFLMRINARVGSDQVVTDVNAHNVKVHVDGKHVAGLMAVDIVGIRLSKNPDDLKPGDLDVPVEGDQQTVINPFDFDGSHRNGFDEDDIKVFGAIALQERDWDRNFRAA